MGAVAVRSRTIGRDKGYPVVEATLYIYCDACGSFSIRKITPLSRFAVAALVCALYYLAGRYIFFCQGIQWLACLIPLGLFGPMLPWRDWMLTYQCRQCGNREILPNNSLHLPAFDPAVINAPEALTQKRYIDEDVVHFSQFT